MIQGAKKVIALSPEKIAELVSEFGPESVSDQQALTATLLARRQFVAGVAALEGFFP